MKLTVAGCSPAWPNAGGAHSGYLFEAEGRLLVDCGPGVLPKLRRLEEWPRIDAIAITHFHLDHWGDLVPWAWGCLHGPGRAYDPPQLLVPPGGRAWLREIGVQLGREEMFEQAFRPVEFAADTPVEVAGFELRALQVPHYAMEAFAFRVSSNGHTVAYSGDSGPTPLLAELGRDADLFVCEATLPHPEEPGPRGHLSLEEASAAFADSGAARFLVTHRPQELPCEGYERAFDGLVLTL